MFAQRLKELRKLNGLSQATLSSLLGVTQQAVGKWETGRSIPDPQTLARVAAYFKVSTDYLLGCAPAPITSAVAAADGPREFPIPIIGTVRAGFGAFAFEEDYGEEYARVKDPGSYFYLLVKGDSMEPRISDGDLALVHRQPTLENGDLGVVIFGEGEGTLKNSSGGATPSSCSPSTMYMRRRSSWVKIWNTYISPARLWRHVHAGRPLLFVSQDIRIFVP